MRKMIVLLLVATVVLFCGNVLAQEYSTTFPLTESPISEGGNWVNGKATGINWQNVRTISGLAFGTQDEYGGYDDSTAVLSGVWGADQTAQATVYSSNISSGFAEVELRLRTTISANSITGYELNYSVVSSNGYCQVVRWNGPLGSWTGLDGRVCNVPNGSVVKGSIVGNLITTFVNGVEIFHVSDNTFTTGSPGIGFYSMGNADSGFGFTSFTATGGGSQPPPPPPPPQNLTLTLLKSGTGTGVVTSSPSGNTCGSTCSSSYGTYASGTIVTLSETPDSNSSFLSWSGACSGTGLCSVTMSSAETVTATFNLLTSSKYTLVVKKSGTGSGTVTSSPSGISCGLTCSKAYNSGTVVTLAAYPNWWTVFTGWSGAGCSGTGSCTVTMDASKTITANFRRGR